MKYTRLCILYIVVAKTRAQCLSYLPHFPSSLLCPTPLCVWLRQLFHSERAYTEAVEGEQTEHPSTEARRSEDEVERRRRRVPRQRQRPPGRSNETEGKKKRRRDAVSLTARCKQNSLRPLLGLKPQAAGSEKEMLSVPEFAPLRRCLGTGGDTTKSHFPALLGAGDTTQKETRGANSSITAAIWPSGAHFVVQLLPLEVDSEGVRRGMPAGWLKQDAVRWFNIHAGWGVNTVKDTNKSATKFRAEVIWVIKGSKSPLPANY